MESKMKKLVRNLSTRTKAPPLDTSNMFHDSRAAQSPRKSSLTSPIPANTVVHFPKCSHSTPPTPRPANIPPVLRTEIIDLTSPMARLAPGIQDLEITGSREDIVPTGLEAENESDAASTHSKQTKNVQIRQYFSRPARCLDCTLKIAHEREASYREQSADVLREHELRRQECSSAIRAVSEVARVKNGQRGVSDGRLLDEDVKVIEKIEEEERYVMDIIALEKNELQEKVSKIWTDVRKEWEGGIREVVRDDGTGEAEETCVFVFPWEVLKEKSGDDEAAEGDEVVQVQWVPLEN